MQALFSTEKIPLKFGLCVDCDAARAVGLAHVQVHVASLMIARLTVLIILKVKVTLALVGWRAGNEGCPLLLDVWVVSLEKDGVQISVSDQGVSNHFADYGKNKSFEIQYFL